MTDLPIHQQVTEYSVSALPEDLCPDAHMWSITVAYRGHGRWAVTHHSQCLNDDGEWDYELQPSSRTDDWLDTHRFDLDTALALARDVAPTLTSNGLQPADLLAKYRPDLTERRRP